MFGPHNRKEQALALLAGNGLVLAHVVTSIRSEANSTLAVLNTLAVMGASAVVGLVCAFMALSHASDDDANFESLRYGAAVGLGISLFTLLLWFVNISDIIRRQTATG